VPSIDGYVSDDYWIEKLKTSSDQDGEEFSAKLTEDEIKRGLDIDLEEQGYEGEELEEMKEYYKGLLEHLDGVEWQYISYAYGNKPYFLDAEDVPFVKDTKPYLKAIFDAFDEICKRLMQQQVERNLNSFGEDTYK